MKQKFQVGQKVVWHCADYESNTYIKATIVEAHDDYAVALSEDNTHLWIDKDNENDFTKGE